MKYLILLFLMVLFGCAEQDISLDTADSINTGSSIISVGTLANANDPYDMASAPIVTKVTITRISATRAIKRNRISSDQAKLVLGCTDAAINATNLAYAHKSFDEMKQASSLADKCRNDLDIYKGIVR